MLIITFHNDGTGDNKVGHYNVEVSINERLLWKTRIENHNRNDGWQGLIETLCNEVKIERAVIKTTILLTFGQSLPRGTEVEVTQRRENTCFVRRSDNPNIEYLVGNKNLLFKSRKSRA